MFRLFTHFAQFSKNMHVQDATTEAAVEAKRVLMLTIIKALAFSSIFFLTIFVLCMICGGVGLFFAGADFTSDLLEMMINRSLKGASVGALALFLLAMAARKKR